MDTTILEEIGLTKTEVKVYIALLRLGQTTTTPLVREAGIHASKVYQYLDRLVSKGLVTCTIQSNRKHFCAADPNLLHEFLREKQMRIEEQKKKIAAIIPDLEGMQKKKKEEIDFQVYEGLRGIKSFYERSISILKKGNTSYLWGAPRIGNEKIEGYLLDWHERRQKKGVRLQAIYDSDNREYGEVRAKMKHSEVRYLPKMLSSPMWIEVSKDIVGIGHIRGNNAILFSIRDEEIAKGYIDYFTLIWEISEKD